MRAAVFHEAGRPLEITAVADPVPAPDQVILAVGRAGICGSDLHMTQYPGFCAPGTILGHEFFGTVVAAGSAVTAWRGGERVTALPVMPCRHCEACDQGLPALCPSVLFVGTALGAPGAFADYVAVRADQLQRVPDGVDDVEAAMIEPLAVGHHTVSRAELRPDDRVLVLGGGPIGAAVALFARAAGVRSVIVSEPAEARRDRCRELGASGVIDPQREDLAARFVQLAGGRPSVVFECVGVPGMLAEAVRVAGLRARIVVAGVVFAEDTFPPLEAMARELTIRYSQAYAERDFAAVIDALARGRVDCRPLHTRTVSLAELPAAFEALRGNPGECKVLVDPALGEAAR
jgi:(R,R)-butanediol dehydrogenase/meso-butanediol dehydrogenase/diacetyl reductase